MNKIKITKEELEKLYYSNFNKVVCKKLGITMVTLIKLLRDNEISLKGMGNRTRSSAKIEVV